MAETSLSDAYTKAFDMIARQSSEIKDFHTKAMELVNKIRPIAREDEVLYWVKNPEMSGETYDFLREKICEATTAKAVKVSFFTRKLATDVYINKVTYLALALMDDKILQNIVGFEICPCEDRLYCEKYSICLYAGQLPEEISKQDFSW